MVDTHVFGAMRVLKGVLPVFRAQRSGVIINMSSFSGLLGSPGAGLYCMCKFALEGISEAYQAELAAFNIRVVILEPGAFRTNVLKRALGSGLDGIGAHYMESAAGNTIRITRALTANEKELVSGDPDKLGQRVVEIVEGAGAAKGLEKVLRFPMGRDSISLIDEKVKKLLEDLELTKGFAQSTDYDGHRGGGATNVGRVD